jgi:predicted HD phosphohydrolase
MEHTSDLYEYLSEKFPPMFTRQEVTKHLGGMFHYRTLRNLDYKGLGPSSKHHLGNNKVLYSRENFIDWLRDYFEKKLN